MAKKQKEIRFGFFRIELCYDKKAIQRRICSFRKQKDKYEKRKADILSAILNDASDASDLVWNLLNEINDKKIVSHQRIGDKLIEFDRASVIRDNDPMFFFFQMVHDRDESLSKKRVDQKREAVQLDDDEYITEYASILYCKHENCAMIQQNRFSVSINQIGRFLSRCMEEYYQKDLPESKRFSRFPVVIELRPIMDREALKAIKNNKEIRKMIIRGSVPFFEALKKTKISLPIIDVGNALEEMKGYSFTVSITAHHERVEGNTEYTSIDKQACENLYQAIEMIPDEERNCNVKMEYLSNEDTKEWLTWSTPLRQTSLSFSVNTREELSPKILYDKMREYFDKNQEDIKRLTK